MTRVARRGRSAGPELAPWLAAREPSIQRTAHLLVGDVQRAQPLVLDTLARLHLGWRRIRGSDIDLEARRLLVHAFRTASPGDTAADARTVLVLRLHEHLDDPDIADLMRTSVSLVRSLALPDEEATARSFAEAIEDIEYPVTPMAAVAERAREIRRERRRTAAKVTAAVVCLVAVVSVASAAVELVRGDDDDQTPPPVAPLGQVRLGAAPGVDYLDRDRFVPASGEPITSPLLRRAATATPYGGGLLVAGRVTSQRPFARIAMVTDGSASRVGCGTTSFVLGGARGPAYWLSDSCRAVDTERLVEGVTGRLIEGSTPVVTTALVAFTPVGRVSDGVVAYGASDTTTVGNATYVLEEHDGSSRLVSHVEVPRGATPNGDLISGLAPNLTSSLVVDADTGTVRWRLRDWSLGQFSPSGRYVVGFRSEALPHLGAVGDSMGIWDAETGHEVLVRDLPGLTLDSLPVWEDDDSVLVVAEDRTGRQAIIRVDTDGTVSRATPVGPDLPSGYRLAASP
jgi:hypothetical protein